MMYGRTHKFSLRNLVAVCVGFASLLAAAQTDAQAAAHFADPVQDVEHVVELIDRRLALMPEVAAWKWRAHQPITDIERESAVLDRSVAEAKAMGLDHDGARRFFDVQIRMARAVQTSYFEQWQAKTAAQVPGRDLNTELRPRLDDIGRDLLVAIYLASAELQRVTQDARFVTRIEQLKKYSGVNDALLAELRAALISLRLSEPPSLEIIHRIGVLRVGTTGDYAPFSSERNGTLSGFDVQLALALARHWGVQVKFVHTSWPDLMDDFAQRRFDIGMSGISVTPERAAQAGFSTAYHTDGKTSIARCEAAAKFSALEKIDRPGIRVIVNPGGTNERFVRERIKRASIVVHADNRTIFDEILKGRADVMITDGIEVDLQVLRHPELCRTVQSSLAKTEKAIMLPRVSPLAEQVNMWLAPQVVNGQLKAQLQRALLQER